MRRKNSESRIANFTLARRPSVIITAWINCTQGEVYNEYKIAACGEDAIFYPKATITQNRKTGECKLETRYLGIDTSLIGPDPSLLFERFVNRFWS